MAIKHRGRYVAGAGAAALLVAGTAFVAGWEGYRTTAYRDSGGVWTICYGHTGPEVVEGLKASREQCEAWLAKDIVGHEARLVACAPQILELPDPSYIAVNSWAFNVGTGAACKSSLIARLKAGDLAGACGELSRWVRVKGKIVKGLVNRRVDGSGSRKSEQALCLEGVK